MTSDSTIISDKQDLCILELGQKNPKENQNKNQKNQA